MPKLKEAVLSLTFAQFQDRLPAKDIILDDVVWAGEWHGVHKLIIKKGGKYLRGYYHEEVGEPIDESQTINFTEVKKVTRTFFE